MDYVELLKNLKFNNRYGRKSPEKAVLLLAVIDMYENKKLECNEIKYDDILSSTYLKVWNVLFPSESIFLSNAFFSYWQLQNDVFWHIVPIRGKEEILDLLSDPDIKPSEAKIQECVKYAELDEDFFFEITLTSSRKNFKRVLLEGYTNLSEKLINRFVETNDCFEDTSIAAIAEYEKLLIKNNDKVNKIELDSEYSNGITEEQQLSITIEYYKFLKNHRLERSLIREMIPDVESLCLCIKNASIKQGDVSPTAASLYENFLFDLKIVLLCEDDSESIIEQIEKSIDRIKGIGIENLDYDSSVDLETDQKGDAKSNDVDFLKERTINRDYSVVNENGICSIVNQFGDVEYSTNGFFKILNGIIYRFNLKSLCFTVKRMRLIGENWNKREKVISVFKESALFKTLIRNDNNYIDLIDDIIEKPAQVSVNGTWYNSSGDLLTEDSIGSAENKDLNPSEEDIINYKPEWQLHKLSNVVKCSYDYLWIMSIIDFSRNSHHQSTFTFDEIACKMIAISWNILNECPDLIEKEPLIKKCVNYFMEESVNGMDSMLTWSSSCNEIFDAIKNYPMGDQFEDFVYSLTETAPYNILKIWFDTSSKRDLLYNSLDFESGCLYAIYPKKNDPYIVVNPTIFNYLTKDNEKLFLFFKKQYINYLNGCVECQEKEGLSKVDNAEKSIEGTNYDQQIENVSESFSKGLDAIGISVPDSITITISVDGSVFSKLENGETNRFRKGLVGQEIADLFLENPKSPYVSITNIPVCPLVAKPIESIKFTCGLEYVIRKVKKISFTRGRLGIFKEIWIVNVELD